LTKNCSPRLSHRARALLGPLAVTVGIFGTTTPASAVHQQVLDIPVDEILTGNPGDLVSVATVVVPTELVGQTCTIAGETENQESVHPDNDLIIVIGEHSFVIPNFEDTDFIVHEAGEVDEVAPTIGVLVRLGPDGVSSGGFRLSIECEVDRPPTTEPTTTLPEQPAPTKPTVDDMPPPSGPTVPASTSTTTEGSTMPVPSSAPPPAGPDTQTPSLPVTGSSATIVIALAGAFLFAAGIATRDVAKSRTALKVDN
jgi:hypothetical protein